jgi:hypothetical protein
MINDGLHQCPNIPFHVVSWCICIP